MLLLILVSGISNILLTPNVSIYWLLFCASHLFRSFWRKMIALPAYLVSYWLLFLFYLFVSFHGHLRGWWPFNRACRFCCDIIFYWLGWGNVWFGYWTSLFIGVGEECWHGVVCWALLSLHKGYFFHLFLLPEYFKLNNNTAKNFVNNH